MSPSRDPDVDARRRTDEQWREMLTPEQFHVTREHGTEAAFTGCFWDCKEAGVYRCVCCGAELFRSEEKYDSGTGWPSFWRPASDQALESQVDDSWRMTRNEVHCRNCGAHLGHMFEDGPPPTGLRYCINSAALQLQPEQA